MSHSSQEMEPITVSGQRRSNGCGELSPAIARRQIDVIPFAYRPYFLTKHGHVRSGHFRAKAARCVDLSYRVAQPSAGEMICSARPGAVDVKTGSGYLLSRRCLQARHDILVANAAPPRLDKAVNTEQEKPGRN